MIYAGFDAVGLKHGVARTNAMHGLRWALGTVLRHGLYAVLQTLARTLSIDAGTAVAFI